MGIGKEKDDTTIKKKNFTKSVTSTLTVLMKSLTAYFTVLYTKEVITIRGKITSHIVL